MTAEVEEELQFDEGIGIDYQASGTPFIAVYVHYSFFLLHKNASMSLSLILLKSACKSSYQDPLIVFVLITLCSV